MFSDVIISVQIDVCELKMVNFNDKIEKTNFNSENFVNSLETFGNFRKNKEISTTIHFSAFPEISQP